MNLQDAVNHLRAADAATPQGQIILDLIANRIKAALDRQCGCGSCPGFYALREWAWLQAEALETVVTP